MDDHSRIPLKKVLPVIKVINYKLLQPNLPPVVVSGCDRLVVFAMCTFGQLCLCACSPRELKQTVRNKYLNNSFPANVSIYSCGHMC